VTAELVEAFWQRVRRTAVAPRYVRVNDAIEPGEVCQAFTNWRYEPEFAETEQSGATIASGRRSSDEVREERRRLRNALRRGYLRGRLQHLPEADVEWAVAGIEAMGDPFLVLDVAQALGDVDVQNALGDAIRTRDLGALWTIARRARAGSR
jgi:hypothetical protein